MVTNFYGLFDAEKAKADEARENIAKYEGLVDECAKKNALLQDFHNALIAEKEKQDADFQAKEDALKKEREAIDEYKKSVDSYKNDLDAKSLDIANSYKDLESKKEELKASMQVVFQDRQLVEKQKQANDDKEKELAEYEQTLRAKAIQFQKAAEGL